jgi:hypothetical protein
MARREAEPTRDSLWRRRLVVLATVLFPLLVLGGALAPQVVSVMLDDLQLLSTDEEYESPELDFEEALPGIPPLPLPLEQLDFGTGYISELLDLQHLFTRSRLSNDPMSRRFSRLLNFPRNHGDVIVMDDVGRQIRDVIFKDPILVGAVTDDSGIGDPGLLALGDPRPIGDGFTFDDPQATGQGDPGFITALPEPSSLGLTLAGLLVFACHRAPRRNLRCLANR